MRILRNIWPFFHNSAYMSEKNWLNLHENFVRDVSLDKEVPLNFGSHPCIEIKKLRIRTANRQLSPFWRRSAISKYFRLFNKVSCFTNIFYNYCCVIEVLPHKFVLLYNITPHRTIYATPERRRCRNQLITSTFYVVSHGKSTHCRFYHTVSSQKWTQNAPFVFSTIYLTFIYFLTYLFNICFQHTYYKKKSIIIQYTKRQHTPQMSVSSPDEIYFNHNCIHHNSRFNMWKGPLGGSLRLLPRKVQSNKRLVYICKNIIQKNNSTYFHFHVHTHNTNYI